MIGRRSTEDFGEDVEEVLRALQRNTFHWHAARWEGSVGRPIFLNLLHETLHLCRAECGWVFWVGVGGACGADDGVYRQWARFDGGSLCRLVVCAAVSGIERDGTCQG